MLNSSIETLFTYRKMLWRVTRNELRARYAGSILGIVWSILAPLLILMVYSVVYLYIFRVRPTGMTELQYVLYIFAGLTPYLMTAEALSLGVGSVVTNKSVLDNTVFPIDLTPAKAVLLSQGTVVAGFSLIIIVSAIRHLLSWTAMMLPIIWVLLFIFLVGLNWILSLINIVFRDLQHLISIILIMIIIGSPIAYTPDMIPPSLKLIIVLNPLAYYFTAFQEILVLGRAPSLVEWITLVVLSTSVFLLGGRFFYRAKRVLVDYV